jgi:hypothetical protein
VAECEISHPNYHGEVKYFCSRLKMDLAQMNRRCPEAELPGSAVLSAGCFRIIRYGVGTVVLMQFTRAASTATQSCVGHWLAGWAF